VSNIGTVGEEWIGRDVDGSVRGLVCCMPHYTDSFLEGSDLSH
jgi:hypothetical protein